MKIILIGNYRPDQQESMVRFARMLDQGFRKQGVQVEIWWPSVVFGRLPSSTTSGFSKWLGYIDKWLIFPILLRWRLFFIKRTR